MNASLTQKYLLLSSREKIMIMLATAVTILLLGITLLIEPALKAYREGTVSLKNQQIQRSSLEQQQQAYAQALAEDPNQQLKTQLSRLEQRQTTMLSQFASELGELVQPGQMTALIGEVLNHARDLQLNEIRSLPPVNIFSDDADMQDIPLYQQGIQLSVEGSYFAVRDFLAGLERMPSQLYWRSLSYQVEDYPTAQVTLEVYTLSPQKAFISVE